LAGEICTLHFETMVSTKLRLTLEDSAPSTTCASEEAIWAAEAVETDRSDEAPESVIGPTLMGWPSTPPASMSSTARP
jgi:hypothetical protein